MTAPMPETMSPREKVAAVLDPEIWADDMPVPTRAAVTDFHARRQASVIKADAILAALASSGDHAELARLAEDAQLPMPEKRRRSWFNRQNRFRDAFTPAVCSALIAENAALRAQSDFYKRDNDVLMKNAWVFRATEAERKLAEADALLAELANAPQPNNAGGRFTRALASVNAYMARKKARTFLSSKEAECG